MFLKISPWLSPITLEESEVVLPIEKTLVSMMTAKNYPLTGL